MSFFEMFTACDKNTYGVGCKQPCGNCSNREQCHHTDGSCSSGCDADAFGETCKESCCNRSYGYPCNDVNGS